MEPEELREGQAWPRGQVRQKGEGAQITEDNAKVAGGDKSTEEGPPLSETELQKDAKGRASQGYGAAAGTLRFYETGARTWNPLGPGQILWDRKQ